MSRDPSGVTAADHALLTDLYQLTMIQAYWKEGLDASATFSLFFRHLPRSRNYMLSCGVEDVLDHLEQMRFEQPALEYLASLGLFTDGFLEWLRSFRFSGDVRAVPDGTPMFPEEPLLEVTAPIAEAQLAESYAINQIHLQTVLASKAARVVGAAAGRPVVDFGMRRMHGADAALKGARAFYVAGVDATSNLLAGWRYGIPLAGTMAHSYVQAHDDEREAFRAFAALYPETVLLVDTYDTLEGVREVVALARELGDDFRVSGVRLDSGDLAAQARRARLVLDEAGLHDVLVFASGNLDEYRVAELVESGAPVGAFGVGTRMGVSADEPAFDLAYKLTDYAGLGRLKTSAGKEVLPGRKQVFRVERDGVALRDVLARLGEDQAGRPLLHSLMEGGKRCGRREDAVRAARARAADERARLPERIRGLAAAEPPYPVEVSPALDAYRQQVRARLVG